MPVDTTEINNDLLEPIERAPSCTADCVCAHITYAFQRLVLNVSNGFQWKRIPIFNMQTLMINLSESCCE